MNPMIIRRKSTQNGRLMPEAYEALSSKLEGVPLSNMNYGHRSISRLRHPLGIYSVSLSSVLDSLLDVLDELDHLRSERPFLDTSKYGWDTELVAKQERFLRYLMDHMDDCVSVLMCFFGDKENFHNDEHVKIYSKSIEPYRSHIGRIVNHVKHQQGRLRFLAFLSAQEIFPGYFVEGIDSDGAPGPALQIHKKFRNADTAFSFARDLRYHLFNIYLVSHYLAEAISAIVRSAKVAMNSSESPDDKIAEIAWRICSLPLIFFPDEVSLSVPSVEIKNFQDDETELVLYYPDEQVQAESPPKETTVYLSLRGDGVTQTFRLPYYQIGYP
jgi:hypothetical protein